MTGSHEPMRVLALSKRHYMSRDLVVDRYGRFRELPLGLARLGAEVTGVCISYRTRPEGVIVDAERDSSVAWHSLNATRLAMPGRNGLFGSILRIGETFRPDIVWAGSDAFNIAVGARVAKLLGAKFCADLYDNLESYGASRLPGVNAALHWGLRRADLVTAISTPLAGKILRSHPGTRVEVLTNAIPEGRFVPMDRNSCRRSLGLPAEVPMVGVAGALSRTRGVQTLWDAVVLLRERIPDLHLTMAGPVDQSANLPAGPQDAYLGLLPQDAVPALINALDVAAVCNRDSDFGRYCFPQKLYEYLACAVPVVAADVGSASDLLAGHPQCLYAADDPQSMADRIEAQLAMPTRPQLPIPTWQDLSALLYGMLREAVAH